MLKNLKFLSLLLSMLVCLSTVGYSQDITSGSIEGTISDSNSAVVPGANIAVQSLGNTAGFSKTATTDENGYFIIPRVPPGTYRVTIKAGNFADKVQDITVAIGKATPVNAVLQAGSATATVDVNSGDAAQIDPGDTKIDTNFTKEVIDALPKGTQFTSILRTAPNVRPEPLSAGFQIDGASGAENVFVVDGQEVTNFRTGQLNANNNVPFELVQEVQVKSTGFEAEYGGATGGVVNVVTIGGNNEFHGTFGLSFESYKLGGKARPFLNRFSNASNGFEYFQPQKDDGVNLFPVARLTGPVIKDKLWFSTVYAPQLFGSTTNVPFFVNSNASTVDALGRRIPSADPSTRTVGSTQQFNFKRKIEEAFVRLDAQPTSKIRMNGTFLWNPIIDQGIVPGYTYGLTNFSTAGPISGSLLNQNDLLNNQGGRQNSNNVNGQLTYTPTNNLVLNFRAGRSYLNEKLGSYGIPNDPIYACGANGNPAIVPGGTAGAGCIRGFTSYPNNVQINYDISKRTTFDADASLIGVNFGGRHNFKFGYQYNHITNDVDRGYRNGGIITLVYGSSISTQTGQTPTGATTDNPTGLCAAGQTTGCNYGYGVLQRFATVGAASSTNNGLFAQDQWQIGNRLTLNVGVRIESEDVPSFNPDNPGIKFGWGDKVAPRLGVAFDVFGNGKTKLFASYGWFYDRFKYELPRGSFGGDFFRRDYFEILPSRGVSYGGYTIANILGTVPDIPGGNCPEQNAPLGNGYSVCQIDFRIPSNSGSGLEIGGAVDPDMKAARQSEYTFGLEHQLFRSLLMSARYTHKQLDYAIEDIGLPNAQGSEAYIIGNPGYGLACEVARDNGFLCTKAQRDYDAFEIRLDKRLSNNYFFNVNYTYSRLYGNYSGLASSDEFGRSSPNVNRFFDLPFLGYTASGEPDNGRLATDRPHVFKAYGGYLFNWFGSKTNGTDISAFTTIQSGTPLTTVYSFYSIASAILNKRGDLGRTEMFTQTDLQLTHRYKFGRDNRFTLEAYVNVNNLFDEMNELTRATLYSTSNFSFSTLRSGGCPTTVCTNEQTAIARVFNGGIREYVLNYVNADTAVRLRNDYGLTNSYQLPREVRFGFRFVF